MLRAVIDLGSNTFHALVARVGGSEPPSVVLDEKRAVRLGEHAFARRRINEEAYARGFRALGELIEIVREQRCDSLSIVATGVFREATNGRRFLAEARGTYDVEIELLDGHTEARLTWLGVAAELAGDTEKLTVLDLGGGSLECAIGSTHVEATHSLPLGMLRLRGHQPAQVRAIVQSTACQVIEQLKYYQPRTVVLSSGTARTLLRLARSIGRVPTIGRHMPAQVVSELATMLTSLCPSALDELGVPAERRDTIATGAQIFDTILDAVGGVKTVYVAQAALREGVLASVTNSLERPFRSLSSL